MQERVMPLIHSDYESDFNRCIKSLRIRSFSGPYFPAFGLNTERYSISLRIQSECGKRWTRKSPNKDILHFSRSVVQCKNNNNNNKKLGVNNHF